MGGGMRCQDFSSQDEDLSPNFMWIWWLKTSHGN